MKLCQLLIIGSGPAGLTAAIYAARAKLDPVLIKGMQPGGQLTMTTEVENFPGFPEGIMGPELMSKMEEQAARFGTSFVETVVSKVDLSKRPFLVECENGDQYKAETLIISTGASAKTLKLAHEKELYGKGISSCATCDAFFYRNKIVHVVGGGDTALEDAQVLSKFASHVTIIHRRDALRASKAMQERIMKNPKIDFLWDSTVSELLFDEMGLNGIKVQNVKTGETCERKTDGLFYGIGHTPNTDFLKGQLELTEQGVIVTKAGHPDTSVPGVFACGDVQDEHYRQAITSAGSGCQAALRVERFIVENPL